MVTVIVHTNNYFGRNKKTKANKQKRKKTKKLTKNFLKKEHKKNKIKKKGTRQPAFKEIYLKG